ncbi:uncharacterized protein LOC110822773 isoform X1 [Carica papaya]|uniref:uncharacterized protein LOC110822773 isoform X1 n=1 Tax=Carica papaya TaxID=3649 RepID=UPI000B8C9FA8|nr:uncharacterized protein LOC110822773 isoform X1 [Carica papaya]XP_021908668.1 uncharacterized protein LOC110822773 isoform X1 [Carica papaya]XP_021908669.1 uncharacterized protein LOC110822773 isoform X1 [Carica papaya]XP_021908670.1 uncharacterized protein LOC110822773 isoform X1 [Carica papaya]
MSTGPVRRVSRQDIQLVQNLIERCLQLDMNQKEVVETLLEQAKIEPGFTELVWQKLEEENREFFNAYYLRLTVKHQIIEFNKLLEQQVRLMHQIHPAGVAAMPTSNGSHIQPSHQNSACYPPEHAVKPENMQPPIGSSLANAFPNGGSSLQTNMHAAVDMSGHASRIDVPTTILPTQGSNITLTQGMNGGGIIKAETGYSGSSYMFCADGTVLDARPSIGDTSGASFSSVESNSQPLNDSLLDVDGAAYGFLGQIPRNFSLSDLTAGAFSQTSDILDYQGSPFLATDTEGYLDSHERERQDNKRLDTISEGLSYDDFGSE